jgi:hypothetical protein
MKEKTDRKISFYCPFNIEYDEVIKSIKPVQSHMPREIVMHRHEQMHGYAYTRIQDGGCSM